MLRIKRSVQAAFNTEASYLAAQAAAARKGLEQKDAAGQAAQEAADPMAAMERDMAAKGDGAPRFVASTAKKVVAVEEEDGEGEEGEGAPAVNPDAIDMDDMDEDDEE